ncbi:hypothetical protein Y1Q_0016394 [Alligator mississippiensis]|uniref:Uncharacterized protein n=1 Tax=Alligator mississippiensis TaxID=8496 RepID=A0A151N2S2_ALLMI|nr:hypothetical protein Y1Q_0016394 [Alligator mississippiensis]
MSPWERPNGEELPGLHKKFQKLQFIEDKVNASEKELEYLSYAPRKTTKGHKQFRRKEQVAESLARTDLLPN